VATRDVRFPASLDTPDVSFRAGVGVYLGAVAAGLALVVGVLADASTGLLVAAFPNVLTVVTVAGAILAGRVTGLAERVGRTRWRRYALGLPALAFATVPVALALSPAGASSRLVLACIVGAVLSGLTAVGVAAMARNRYVDAVTLDDPAATLPWRNSRYVLQSALGLAMVVLGALQLRYAWSDNPIWVFWMAYGAFMLVQAAGRHLDAGWLPEDLSGTTQGELRIHEAGIVRKRPFARTLVPWDAVTGVRLTDDELVVERRWFDLRCDREALDDPDGARGTIERLWRSSEKR
jgi:uncharacterized membrane protein YidH (DUF202 family)